CLLSADDEPVRGRRQACGRLAGNSRSLVPATLAALPQRSAVDDRPERRALTGQRCDWPSGERLVGDHVVALERPQAARCADQDSLGHARMILSADKRVMKTDLLLIPMSARWADMRAAALAAEEAGFDGLWTWDHLRDPDDDH